MSRVNLTASFQNKIAAATGGFTNSLGRSVDREKLGTAISQLVDGRVDKIFNRDDRTAFKSAYRTMHSLFTPEAKKKVVTPTQFKDMTRSFQTIGNGLFSRFKTSNTYESTIYNFTGIRTQINKAVDEAIANNPKKLHVFKESIFEHENFVNKATNDRTAYISNVSVNRRYYDRFISEYSNMRALLKDNIADLLPDPEVMKKVKSLYADDPDQLFTWMENAHTAMKSALDGSLLTDDALAASARRIKDEYTQAIDNYKWRGVNPKLSEYERNQFKKYTEAYKQKFLDQDGNLKQSDNYKPFMSGYHIVHNMLKPELKEALPDIPALRAAAARGGDAAHTKLNEASKALLAAFEGKAPEPGFKEAFDTPPKPQAKAHTFSSSTPGKDEPPRQKSGESSSNTNRAEEEPSFFDQDWTFKEENNTTRTGKGKGHSPEPEQSGFKSSHWNARNTNTNRAGGQPSFSEKKRAFDEKFTSKPAGKGKGRSPEPEQSGFKSSHWNAKNANTNRGGERTSFFDQDWTFKEENNTTRTGKGKGHSPEPEQNTAWNWQEGGSGSRRPEQQPEPTRAPSRTSQTDKSDFSDEEVEELPKAKWAGMDPYISENKRTEFETNVDTYKNKYVDSNGNLKKSANYKDFIAYYSFIYNVLQGDLILKLPGPAELRAAAALGGDIAHAKLNEANKAFLAALEGKAPEPGFKEAYVESIRLQNLAGDNALNLIHGGSLQVQGTNNGTFRKVKEEELDHIAAAFKALGMQTPEITNKINGLKRRLPAQEPTKATTSITIFGVEKSYTEAEITNIIKAKEKLTGTAPRLTGAQRVAFEKKQKDIIGNLTDGQIKRLEKELNNRETEASERASNNITAIVTETRKLISQIENNFLYKQKFQS